MWTLHWGVSYSLLVTFRRFCLLMYWGFEIRMWNYFWNVCIDHEQSNFLEILQCFWETLHLSFITDAQLILLAHLHHRKFLWKSTQKRQQQNKLYVIHWMEIQLVMYNSKWLHLLEIFFVWRGAGSARIVPYVASKQN